MSGLALGQVNAAENEFLAENTLISIQSNIDHGEFFFLSGHFGPLEVGMPCTVPLWLAVLFRKRGMCTIIVPEWMTVKFLEDAVAAEPSLNTLSEIPFHYMEIAQLILTNAKTDVDQAEQVALLLQDYENIRMDRIRYGIMNGADLLYNNGEIISVASTPNIGSLEILRVKSVFIGAMQEFHNLGKTDSNEGGNREDGGTGKGRRGRRFSNDT